MFKRVLTSVLGLPIVFFVVGHAGWFLVAATAIIATVGQFELYRALSKRVGSAHFMMMALSLAFMILLPMLYAGQLLIFLLLAMLISLSSLTFKNFKPQDALGLILGFFYITLFMSALYFTRGMDDGLQLMSMVFIISWGCDTGAYFAGKSLGKRKLNERLSPTKTVEGSIGGALSAMLLSAVFVLITNGFGFAELNMLPYIILGLIGAIAAQVGDLAASSLKRAVGIKDYGGFFPGHGGVLDRFDSVLFVSPVVYIFATIIF